jgi:RNA polymerase sigma-70 factor (ECF subfamily)
MAVSSGVSADDRLAEIEDLYRTRFRHFLRVAIAITGRPALALEAVQDAFGDAIRSRNTFRGEGSLEAWIWRLVVNASRDVRAQVGPEFVEPAAVAESSNGRVDSSELREAIAALPERQRLVLFLRYYADLDYRAIAEALEIKTGTVSAMLNQAHRALRRILEEVEA